jgi:hypothetical protein
MRLQDETSVGIALLICLVWAPAASFSQIRHGKSVWNYDGGVIFATDGSLPNGACFRVSGEVNSGEFFNNLKRVDSERGAVFQRGTEIVSEFPQVLDVSFAIRDHPCTPGRRETGPRTYLSREMMSHLQLFVYWKRGVDLRPVKDVREVGTRVERITPFARELAAELPERFEWSYQLSVPSAGVPLTDSLVFVFRTVDEQIAARVAARL